VLLDWSFGVEDGPFHKVFIQLECFSSSFHSILPSIAFTFIITGAITSISMCSAR
jgi:hypothetical protein